MTGRCFQHYGRQTGLWRHHVRFSSVLWGSRYSATRLPYTLQWRHLLLVCLFKGILKLITTGYSVYMAICVGNLILLHDWPWISPWIKSISNELDITCHVVAPQSSGNCDAINNRSWRHQPNINRGSGKRRWCMRVAVFIVIDWIVCRVRNKITHVFSWRTVYALIRVLVWCLFPSVLSNSGNKHKNNPLVSA